MPVKPKNKIQKTRNKTVGAMATNDETCCCPTTKPHCSDVCKKVFATFMGVLLVYLIFLVGTMIRNNLEEYKYIGQADKLERTITVEAEGKITAKPDVAVTTMGMIAEADTVAAAQAENTKVMNNLITKLKALGVEEKDIQTTNYNIYPQYNYTEDEGRVLSGYQVSQSVTAKIRDLENANQVLALAGEVGANSVSGLDFTIDDREVYKTQARDEALKKISEKAQALSQSLGVRMVGVVSYNEYEGSSFDTYKAYAMEGLGGGGAPMIESGSMDVLMNVSVVFEIR